MPLIRDIPSVHSTRQVTITSLHHCYTRPTYPAPPALQSAFTESVGFPGGSAIKNLPAMQEMQVQSLSREDPLEEELATHSSILAWRIPVDRGAWWAAVRMVKESDMTEAT